MAPSPEYDKEPKAPDKSATNISSEDSKVLHNLINDQLTNSDHKSTNATANSDVENNKHVEALDDGQLRALLDEAITYKCPKDREGKSSLFKELLEEVEQDEQACEAAARGCRGGGGGGGAGAAGGRRGARSWRALPHSNSLQDLVAALAAEPTPRRHHARHHAHAPAPHPANVSARAIHGGSLPSGVDTSSMLSEEPARGAYLATVRCVNPPPLAERRVSASDANAPHDADPLARRSKPMFQMTYTARATLEIGSGSVCSGRAVTTTTASNQVRLEPRGVASAALDYRPSLPTCGPPERLFSPSRRLYIPDETDSNQRKLMNAICSKMKDSVDNGGESVGKADAVFVGKDSVPRGPKEENDITDEDAENVQCDERSYRNIPPGTLKSKHNSYNDDGLGSTWFHNVDNWYEGLKGYSKSFDKILHDNSKRITGGIHNLESNEPKPNLEIYSKSISHQYGSNVGCDKIYNTGQIDYIPNYISTVAHSLPHNISMHARHVPIQEPKNKSDKRESLYSNVNVSYELGQNYVNSNRVVEESKIVCDNIESDIRLRKKYREKVGKTLVAPTSSTINPRNVRSMTIGKPLCSFDNIDNKLIKKSNNKCNATADKNESAKSKLRHVNKTASFNVDGNTELSIDIKCDKTESFDVSDQQSNSLMITSKTTSKMQDNYLVEFDARVVNSTPEKFKCNNDIELVDMSCNTSRDDIGNTGRYSQYFADQQKLLQVLEATNSSDVENEHSKNISNKDNDGLHSETADSESIGNTSPISSNVETQRDDVGVHDDINLITSRGPFTCSEDSEIKGNEIMIPLNKKPDENATGERYILAELPNNAYIFLTLPKRSSSPHNNRDDNSSVQLREIENDNGKPFVSERRTVARTAKRKDIMPVESRSKRNTDQINKNALKVLLFQNLLKGDKTEKLGKSGVSSFNNNEVDSAIPFSCITTPEVVASCNTTSSASQLAVAVDPKPLQLESSYRAVASLTGPAPLAPAPAPTPARALAPYAPCRVQPRSVVSNSFNSLPLSRPNYGATATTATDDYKKSLDENGNAVQGYTSPLSGSSQQKKPRRKKSSKNETVIDCRQIDGYQGDKDVNELLRFIESNAEGGRGAKLGRAKHKDDSDDKGAKKRSADRRKDKEAKPKRASSLDELSRTKLEDLTAGPPRDPPGKPERRSWGDDAFRYADAPPEAAAAAATAAEQADFQTVTKKRKPRRRADEPAPRRARAPSPRARRESAPVSDRSNDSNDDLDSVHSLPADAPRAPPAPPPPPPPPPPAPASYADIARTRHNIPDLIESCNFYAEGEGEGAGEPQPPADPPPSVPGDADGYPALETRAGGGAVVAGGKRARDAKPATAPAGTATATAAGARRERKERPAAAREPECPAPDVVADRRPPVILLDSAARARDMDGVTFGFDINEQLLGGGARRAGCDLLRDALEGGAGVPVRAGCAALRYLPPDLPPHSHHLLQIVDYVGGAWEDVVRCGGGKVRYFSE